MNFSQSFLLDHVTDCLCLMQTSVNKQSRDNATTVKTCPSLHGNNPTLSSLMTFSISERYNVLSVLSVLKFIWSLQTTLPWFPDMVVKSGYGNAPVTDMQTGISTCNFSLCNTSHTENGTLFNNITISSFPGTALTN